MVSQVNGRFPDRGGSAAFAGASATIRKSNGTRGLIAFEHSVHEAGRGNRRREENRRPIRNWRSQMTLIKSLLLGSAAGIVAVATAQAADLPTRKAAPVEYVRVCNVGGITGWTLPGSDTCVKFSGYMTAHFIGGNISNQYNSAGAITSAIDKAVDPFASPHLSQVLMVEGGDHTVPVFNALTGAPIIGAPTTSADPSRGPCRRSTIATPLRRVLVAASRTRRMRFSIATRSAGTSAPISALISLRTPLMAR